MQVLAQARIAIQSIEWAAFSVTVLSLALSRYLPLHGLKVTMTSMTATKTYTLTHTAVTICTT